MLSVRKVLEVTQCSVRGGWVHKQCSDVNGSLSIIGDAFVCKVCKRADDEDDTNIQENMDLGQSRKVLLSGRYAEWRIRFSISGSSAFCMRHF